MTQTRAACKTSGNKLEKSRNIGSFSVVIWILRVSFAEFEYKIIQVAPPIHKSTIGNETQKACTHGLKRKHVRCKLLEFQNPKRNKI